MRTSVTGMAAQSNRLSAVAGNVANTSTVGYKAAQAQFSTLVLDGGSSTYTPGAVETSIRNEISRQGVLERSGSQFDLAVSGNGFFLVESPQGETKLTRAGAFVPNGDGELVNSAGFRLLGLPIDGTVANVPVNGTAGLQPIGIIGGALEVSATTEGRIVLNLPSSASAVAAIDLPSKNQATSVASARSSIVTYGKLGEEKTLDLHFARTTTAGQWEVSVYDADDRAAGGGFPYSSPALTSATIAFDANGELNAAGSTLSLVVPGGDPMTLNLTGSTQLASGFAVAAVEVDGSPPADGASFDIGVDGKVFQVLGNGSRRAIYQIPLATVISPDKLNVTSGNTFTLSRESGDLLVGVPGTGTFGSMVSGALEASNVDLAGELTSMVEAQRNYTANSRVFQTGSELLEVLVNLKR